MDACGCSIRRAGAGTDASAEYRRVRAVPGRMRLRASPGSAEAGRAEEGRAEEGRQGGWLDCMEVSRESRAISTCDLPAVKHDVIA